MRALFSARLPLLLWLALTLTFVLPVAAQALREGPLPQINFELVADGSSIFADKGSRFIGFPGPPVIHGDDIYFVGKRDNGVTGIYRTRRGKTSLMVDTTAAIPGGQGSFSSLDGTPMGAGDRVVFRATGSQQQQGIYLLDQGQLKRIADTQTTMPRAGGRFKSFKRPVFDGQAVVFVGRSFAEGEAAAGGVQGAYRYELATGILSVLADTSTPLPGSTRAFAVMDDITVGRGLSLLTAADQQGATSIHSVDASGALRKLVDSSTPTVNAPDQTLSGLNDGTVDRSFETDNFAFRTHARDGRHNGLHAWIDGRLHTMADVRAEMSGGSQMFGSFGKPNVYRDRVFFIGRPASGKPSIYAWRKGGRFPVIHGGLTLGGRTPRDFNMSLEAAGASGLVFHVSFEDGSQAIYLAHFREQLGRLVLSDPLNGSTIGQRQGGRFVEGGGWTLLQDKDRIVWNIPPMSAHGLLEVDIRNFDPRSQLTAAKNIFLGLWGTLFNNHERMNLPNTDNWELRVGKAHPQFKIEYHARGFGKAVEWAPFDEAFDLRHTYRIRVEWHMGRVTSWVDEKVLHFDGLAYEPVDHFRFLHIGTSSHFGGTGTVGPIYSNVRILSFD
jgi:hypothetical protein